MIIPHLKTLFNRDLNKLYKEIEQYKSEASIWKTEKKIANSAGNLCLHLVGNLNTYIGQQIGKTGYVRNRDLEFSLKDVSRDELLKKVEDTKKVVNDALDGLSEDALDDEYPLLVFEEKTSVGYLLIHLATHLTYHLGQINYHRRLLDS